MDPERDPVDDLPRAWHFGRESPQPDDEEFDLGYEAALPGLQALLAQEVQGLAI